MSQAKKKPISDLVFNSEHEPSEHLGVMGEFKQIDLDKLYVDLSYQRDVLRRGQQTIKQIIEGFDWAKFEPLIVSENEELPGFFAILDGQHRALAAHMHGSIVAVPCIVHKLNLKQQARVYRDINSVITKMNRLQLHAAGVTGGAPSAVGIDNVCKNAGVEIMRYNLATNKMKSNQTVSIKAIGDGLKRDGYNPVFRALLALKDAGNKDQTIVTAKNIRILSTALSRLPYAKNSDVVAFLKSNDISGQMDIYRETSLNKPGKGALQQTIEWAVREISKAKTGIAYNG